MSRFRTVRPLIIVVVATAGCFLFSGCSDPYRTAAPLDVAAYLASANSLRGNTYKLEGEVKTMLAWSPSGRLVSVGIDDGKKALAVLLPTELNDVNIEKGQKFNFLLVVDDKGILRAKKLTLL